MNSIDHGKPIITEWVRTIGPATVVDVGAGAGTYRDLIGGTADWTAVEIWGPFVREYDLPARYDRVIIGDAVWLDWSLLPCDLVIFGDVLEHLPYDTARWVWSRARQSARWVVGSIPVGEWPQGEVAGNPFETHQVSWTTDQVAALPGVVEHHEIKGIVVCLAGGVRASAG